MRGDASAVIMRVARFAPQGVFDPAGRCLLCAYLFDICEHTEQEIQWAIAVATFNQRNRSDHEKP